MVLHIFFRVSISLPADLRINVPTNSVSANLASDEGVQVLHDFESAEHAQAYPKQILKINFLLLPQPKLLVVFKASIFPGPGVKELTSIYPSNAVNDAIDIISYYYSLRFHYYKSKTVNQQVTMKINSN